MKNLIALIFVAILSPGILNMHARESESFDFKTVAPDTPDTAPKEFRLRSNMLPWLMAVPDLGAEFVTAKHWSLLFDVWFSQWSFSDKYSLKTVAILPEVRWWVKTAQKGSFLNFHGDVAWFNARFRDYRYQDYSRPLFGAGIGYGYRLNVNQRWAFEFEVGAGYANIKYNRYYNVPNGAWKDTREYTYWGVDRVSIAVVYYICDL